MTIDPIEQFKLENLFKIGQIGNHAIYFTSSSAYMLLAVVLTAALMIGGVAGGRLVPGRMQSIAEIT
jgi:F-type H+-transporting ATPase subunit a